MSFPGAGGGGDNSVFVSIGGNSMPLVEALRAAAEAAGVTAESFNAMAAAASSSGGTISESTKASIAALRTLTDQATLTTRSMQVLADVSEVMGGAAAESAASWLAASSGAAEYGARLDYLVAQVRLATEANEQLARRGGGLSQWFGSLGLSIEGAAGKMLGFIENAGSMLAGLVSFSVLNDVIQEVKGFTDALVQLNIQTEKNQFSWQYLYGGGRTPKGAAIAQQMADWTKSFSMQIPYTRQDLLNAVTTLAPAGLSAAGLEHYMPTIADLAATRAPNMNLSQIAQVIMSASMGYTRMLKYDLKINPEELMQYGLDATGRGVGIHINNPETLLPALENYAKAKGLSGAAKDIAHDTFWGSWSSFIDRIQNFELDSGKGLFGSLKTALNDLSSWIDAHYDQINRFAALFSDTLANAFKTAAGWVGDFMAGVGQTGLLTGLVGEPAVTNQHLNTGAHSTGSGAAIAGKHPIAARLATTNAQAGGPGGGPGTPQQQLSFWQNLGKAVGDALTNLGAAKDLFLQIMQAIGIGDMLKSIGDNLKLIGDALTPDDRELLKEIGAILLLIVAAPIIGGIIVLAGGLQLVVWWMQNAVPWTLQLEKAIRDKLGQALGWVKDRIGDFFGKLGDLKDKLGEVKDKFTAWAGDLKDKFLTWGKDMIGNLVSGIQAKMTDLGNALAGVGGKIASVLHHSTPDEGPLANDDTWMPDMMGMFARQIRDGTPGLSAAMAGAASAMAHGLRPSGGYLPAGATAGGMGAGSTVIVINGSSTLEVMKIIDYAMSKQGRNTNLEMRASSGAGFYQFGTLGGH